LDLGESRSLSSDSVFPAKSADRFPSAVGVFVRIRSRAEGDDGNGADGDGDDGDGDGDGVGDGDHSTRSTLTRRLATSTLASMQATKQASK